MFGLIPALIALGFWFVALPVLFLGLPALSRWQLRRKHRRGY